MKTKICSKCGEVQGLDCFHKDKGRKDGLQCQCKACQKSYAQANKEVRVKYLKIYQEENKERLTANNKIYHQNNKERLNAISRAYGQANREAITARNKTYNQINKEVLAEKSKIYREKNKEILKARKQGPATTKQWLKRIPAIDKPLFKNGQVTVECKNCHKRFAPSKAQINGRAAAWNGRIEGESNLYCSDKCKYTCPLFNFHTQNTDPKSKLYVKKTEQQKARNCQTNHLKELQIDETGDTYCEKCGAIGPVDLHHTATIQKKGMQAVNSAGHILLCKNCHINLHKECGK